MAMVMATGTISVQPLFWLKQQLGDDCQDLPLDDGQELVLDDPRFAFLTLTEQHQLHWTSWPSGPGARRAHVAACPAGQFLMGSDPLQTGAALVLTGAAGTAVWRVPVAALAVLAGRPEGDRRLARLLNGWVRLLLDALPEADIPAGCREVKPGQTVEVDVAPGPIRAAIDPCWIAPVAPPTHYRGLEVAALGVVPDCWPLREDTVAVCPRGGFRVWSTARLLAVDATASFTRGFTALAIAALGQRAEHPSPAGPPPAPVTHLDLEPPRATQDLAVAGDELAEAIALIHRDLGQAGAPALERPRRPGLVEVATVLARSTGAGSRPVQLDGPWWMSPGGPLLAFVHDDAGDQRALRPVALLPRGNAYRLFDPRQPRWRGQRIDAGVAAGLHLEAHQFYRALPDRVTGPGLVRFLFRGSGRDLLVVAATGLLLALLALLVPLATGLIVDRLLPAGERGLLVQLVLVLLSASAGGWLFDLAQGFARLRLQTRLDAEGEAGVWDRLLRLPLPGLRAQTVGDLIARMDGLADVRAALANATATGLLGGTLALGNLGLLIYLDRRLALACLGLVLAGGLVGALACAFQPAARRRAADLQGQQAGLLLQLVGNVAKLRVAGAERRAFAVWANLSARRRSAELRLTRIGSRGALLGATLPVLCSGLLYLLASQPAGGPWRTGTLSTGQFLTFQAALGALLAAALSLAAALARLATSHPLYQRARPLLTAPPEAQAGTDGVVAPPALSGQIELSRLSFRYHPDGPLVLDDVSLRIDPGQLVAIVGPSGSGKTTLLKLLLGLHRPEAGNVYYDGLALSSLDARVLRQQMGVVLDSQRQRRWLDQALARRPRLLLLDDTIDALDGEARQQVSSDLMALAATRVVITHDPSLIAQADHVVRLERGRIVEQGRFQDLATVTEALQTQLLRPPAW